MCGKVWSTLATRTSCPHANWPGFILDGGKYRFNCPLIHCRMLVHQQLPWHTIKHTRKHYFSTQIINSAQSHKILPWIFFFFLTTFLFSPYKTAGNEFHLSGLFGDSAPVNVNTRKGYLILFLIKHKRFKIRQGEMFNFTQNKYVREWALLRSARASGVAYLPSTS